MSGRCPFCGLDPYERVDVGFGSPGLPVAVTCCEFGPLLFDWRTKVMWQEIAERIADDVDELPHGEARYNTASALFQAAQDAEEEYQSWSAKP